MITERFFEDSDLPLLAQSVAPNGIDQDAIETYFRAPGTVASVFGDDEGPVLFVRGSKTLRLELALSLDAGDERKAKVLVEGLARVAEKARQHGFTELVMNCDIPSLREVAIGTFGFVASGNDLTKAL